MKTNVPLSLQEAKAIKELYDREIHNIKQAYDTPQRRLDCIVVAPADMLNKWFFVNYFMEYRDNDTALKFYKHAYYELVAIIYNIHPSGDVEYTYRDLSALLEENKINSITYETNA